MALGPFKDPFATFESVRAYQFFFLLPSLGLLLIPLAWIVLRRRAMKTADPARWLFISQLACAAILTLLLQLAVMMAAAPPSPLPIFYRWLHFLRSLSSSPATPEFFAL